MLSLHLQLKTAFEDLTSKQLDQEKFLVACKDKDDRSTKMISDLTQVKVRTQIMKCVLRHHVMYCF